MLGPRVGPEGRSSGSCSRGEVMVETTEAGAAVDTRPFIRPESALVRAALDLMATHVVDADEGDSGATECMHCGLQYPCPTVLHARQVVNAGGLDRPVAA